MFENLPFAQHMKDRAASLWGCHLLYHCWSCKRTDSPTAHQELVPVYKGHCLHPGYSIPSHAPCIKKVMWQTGCIHLFGLQNSQPKQAERKKMFFHPEKLIDPICHREAGVGIRWNCREGELPRPAARQRRAHGAAGSDSEGLRRTFIAGVALVPLTGLDWELKHGRKWGLEFHWHFF